jgi:hypothetical protein
MTHPSNSTDRTEQGRSPEPARPRLGTWTMAGKKVAS